MSEVDFEKINQKYSELLFVSEVQERHLKLLLLIHAINLSSNLKCVGSMEDDPEEECLIPRSWNNNQDDTIDVNCVNSKDPGNIHDIIFKENILKSFDENQLKQAFVNRIMDSYQKKILNKILEKPESQQQQQSQQQQVRIVPDDNFLWNQPRNNPLRPIPLPDFNNPLGIGQGDIRLFPNIINPYGPNSSQSSSLLGPNAGIFNGGYSNPLPQGPFTGNIRQDPWGPDGLNGSFPDNNDIEPIYRPQQGSQTNPRNRNNNQNFNRFF